MEWPPTPKDEVVNVADPPTTATVGEMALPLSRKTTFPVAAVGEMLAVKVRGVPKTEGLVPVLSVNPSVVALVRTRIAVSRAFCNDIGQSLLAALKGAQVVTIVTTPGINVPGPVTSYATAMSVVPS